MSDVEHVPDDDIEIDGGKILKKCETASTIDAKRNTGQTNYCLKIILKVAFSTPGLVVLVIAYSIMGAFIFPLLEAPREVSNIAAIAKSREDCLKELWTITEKLNVLYEKNWTMLVHEQLRRFEGSIVTATKNGLNTVDTNHSTRWSFSEALLYSVTVITTIGHGSLTPKTSGGKVVTILYALIGVPLMLMCLSNLGGLLAEALQCTYSRICRSRGQHNHHHQNSCEGQSHEMDCNICKYDAVSSETKLHCGYDYTGVNEREDSCQLLHNSPSKLNHTTSQCMQVKSHPIIKQYTVKSVEASPIKHHMMDSHQVQQQQQHQYYPMTALNYRNNISCRGGGGGGGGAGIDSSAQQLTQNATTTVYFPVTSSTGNHFTCSSAIHYNQPIVKYHAISLQQQQQQQQQQHHQLSNSPNKVMSNHPHTATVHGIRRGKFIPKPMPQEINMLLAESDLTSSYRHDTNTTNTNEQSTKLCENIVDIMEDEEENEQNRMGCPHGTPSRIPLISTSPNKNLHSMEIEQDIGIHDDRGGGGDGFSGIGSAKGIGNSSGTNSGRMNHQRKGEDGGDATSRDSIDTNTTTVQVPITIVLFILVSYICLGTVIFAFWENWSFIDGAYFCFVTLSTIGYGDFLPQKTFYGPNLQLFACCAYLLLGLVLVAMSFNVLETQLMWKCRKIAVRLKLAKD